MRNYIYVSGRKVERLSGGLPSRSLDRLRGLNLQVGPVGAGFSLGEAPGQTIIAAAAEVEAELQNTTTIRQFDAPDLRNGHWFMAEGLDMAYGIHHVREASGLGAAIFTAEQDHVRVLLSGSAEYLLDRRVNPVDIGDSMSDPQAIYRLLLDLGEESMPLSQTASPQENPPNEDYAISTALQVMGSYGRQPMSFLAQAMRVTETPDGINVIGTPLWVAMAVPE